VRALFGRVQDSRGQTLVEFAIVLPIILVILLGTLDFARAVFVYNTLSESARQGARVAIVNQNSADVAATAVAYAPTTGLTDAGVTACFKAPATLLRDCASPAVDACVPLRPGCLAIVTTEIDYQPLTPILAELVGPISLTSTSISPIEYACTEDCP
jgi:hypothetical protein